MARTKTNKENYKCKATRTNKKTATLNSIIVICDFITSSSKSIEASKSVASSSIWSSADPSKPYYVKIKKNSLVSIKTKNS